MVSRRRFITMGGSMAAAGLLAAGPIGNNVVGASAGSRTFSMTKARFEVLVGKKFGVRDVVTGEKGIVRLAEVTELQNPLDKSLHINRETYSLVFENVGDNELEQGSYRFDYHELRDIDLLMVPVSSETGVLEVLFNNLNT